jgi:gas vesicle protein
MSKVFLGAVIGAAIVGALVFALNRPEPVPPTPEERLTKAAEEIRDATQESVEAASDAAREAVGGITAQVTEGYADVAERVAQTSQETQIELTRFLAEWRAKGIVTEEGVDFAAATEAIEGSELSAEAKENTIAVLSALRDAPGTFEKKINALRTLLEK